MDPENPGNGDVRAVAIDRDDHRTLDIARGMVLIVDKFNASLAEVLGTDYRRIIRAFFECRDREDKEEEKREDGPTATPTGLPEEEEEEETSKKSAMLKAMVRVRESLAPYIGGDDDNDVGDNTTTTIPQQMALALGSSEDALFQCLRVLLDGAETFSGTLRSLYGANFRQAVLRQWTMELGCEEDEGGEEEEEDGSPPRKRRRRKRRNRRESGATDRQQQEQ